MAYPAPTYHQSQSPPAGGSGSAAGAGSPQQPQSPPAHVSRKMSSAPPQQSVNPGAAGATAPGGGTGAAPNTTAGTTGATPSFIEKSGVDLFLMKVMRLPSPFLKLNTVPIGVDPDGPIDRPTVPAVSASALSSSSSSSNSVSSAFSASTAFADTLALSSSLNITSSLGSVYLGESFRTCISIAHQSRYDLQSVGVKIEMQTVTARATLVDTTSADQTFAFKVGETADYIIQHNITEAGVNCLVCCIYYNDEIGQRKTFQKFFKFEVYEPFVIRPALKELSERDRCFAELSVTSLIPYPVYISDVSFVSESNFVVNSLNTVEDPQAVTVTPLKPAADEKAAESSGVSTSLFSGENAGVSTAALFSYATNLDPFVSHKQSPAGVAAATAAAAAASKAKSPTAASSSASSTAESKTLTTSAASATAGLVSTFGTSRPLTPQSTRSYLFELHNQNPFHPNLENLLLVGQFHIAWHSLIGEGGRILSKPLFRGHPTKAGSTSAQASAAAVAAVANRDFDMILVRAPAEVPLETPFTIYFEVRNRCGRKLDLRLQLLKERMISILPFGPTVKSLGVFEAFSRRVVSVELIALGLGIQPLSAPSSGPTTAGGGGGSGFRLLCPTSGVVFDLEHAHSVLVTKPPNAP